MNTYEQDDDDDDDDDDCPLFSTAVLVRLE